MMPRYMLRENMQRSEQSGMKTGLEHLKNHVEYPATKNDIVTACNNLSDVPKADKDWFEKNLPDRTYKNAEEVLTAIIGSI